MILYINTKEQNRVTVSLKQDGEVVASLSEVREYGSQVLLPMIEKLLKQAPTSEVTAHSTSEVESWGLLDGVEVETGLGSFTGIRVGVSVANALGFALNIPVNGKKMETELNY